MAKNNAHVGWGAVRDVVRNLTPDDVEKAAKEFRSVTPNSSGSSENKGTAASSPGKRS